MVLIPSMFPHHSSDQCSERPWVLEGWLCGVGLLSTNLLLPSNLHPLVIAVNLNSILIMLNDSSQLIDNITNEGLVS